MNIWEAYQQLSNGFVVKVKEGDKDREFVTYIFRTEEKPIGKVRYKKVEALNIEDGERPQALEDLDIEDLDEVCIKSFERDDFECIPFSELLGEAQAIWDARQEEEDDD